MKHHPCLKIEIKQVGANLWDTTKNLSKQKSCFLAYQVASLNGDGLSTWDVGSDSEGTELILCDSEGTELILCMSVSTSVLYTAVAKVLTRITGQAVVL